MVLRLIITRLISAVLTLIAVSLVIFMLVQLLPGDIAARALGRFATPTAKQAFRDSLHLDEPAYVRYGLYLNDMLHGNLGTSLINNRQVATVVGERLGNTLIMGGYAFLLYIPLSLLFAIVAAVFRERAPDSIISIMTLIENSLPEFAVGTMLMLLFAVIVPIFPVMSLVNNAKTYPEFLRTMALPVITLTISLMPHAVRMLRDNLIDVLGSEYVRMATLKGLPLHQVILRYALPNALIPLLNIAAGEMAYLIGGVVVVEQVFSYPGIGGLLVSSVFLRDVPVIQAISLLISAIYIGGNLVADVATVLLSPRLRTN